MARTTKVICPSCEGTYEVGAAHCAECGRPTEWATHQERVEWEVGQWRRSRGAVATQSRSVSAPPRPSSGAIATGATAIAPPERNGSGSAERMPPGRPRNGWLKRLAARLRALFGSRRLMTLDDAPAAPAAVATVPAAAVPPAAVPARQTPAAPVATAPVTPAAAAPLPATPVATNGHVTRSLNGAASGNGAHAPVAPAPAARVPVARPAPPSAPAARPTAAPAPAPAPKPAAAPAPTPPPLEPKPTALKATAQRARKKTPTNKEMLQKTLTVLTKVERRLSHLEKELAATEARDKKAPPEQSPAAPTSQTG